MVEEIAPLQSTLILDEGGENSEPRRMPITSVLYEFGGSRDAADDYAPIGEECTCA